MNHLVSDTKYLKKFLEKVRQAKIHDNCSIIQDTYTHIINLKLYHQYLFQEIEEPFLSEADYQVKASGSLFETIFRGSDIILHWGETISYNCQVLGQRPKMDVRFISKILSRQEYVSDLSKNPMEMKPYLLVFSWYSFKSSSCVIDASQEKLFVSPCCGSVMGSEATTYFQLLANNGLYVINELANIYLQVRL